MFRHLCGRENVGTVVARSNEDRKEFEQMNHGRIEMGRTEPPSDEQEFTGVDEAEQLRIDVRELQDKYVRTLADFDNYRKRLEREREEIGALEKRDVLLGLVEIA